jgi:hypothetical protein
VTLSAETPGDSADHVAVGALPSGNGAKAPADNPEDADTLPARALRPGVARRDEAARDDAVADAAEPPAAAGTSASQGASRGTPGMSQPGSAIVASSRQDEPSNQSLTHSIIVASTDTSRAIIGRYDECLIRGGRPVGLVASSVWTDIRISPEAAAAVSPSDAPRGRARGPDEDEVRSAPGESTGELCADARTGAVTSTRTQLASQPVWQPESGRLPSAGGREISEDPDNFPRSGSI